MYLPSFELTGRVAVVTGASRGIGRALAIGLAEAGADVAVLARSKDDLEKVAAEIRDLGRKAYPHAADITKREEIEDTMQKIAEEAGSIDILVNNAGMNIRTPALDVTEDIWQKLVDTNMKSAFMMSQTAAHYMKNNKRSKIINIASVDGFVGATTGVVYGMTKAALIHMTKVLAIEWAQYNINVNAIDPWYFKTQITEEKLSNPEYLEYVLARTPMKRIGEFEDLVGPTVFLSSDASDFVTGQTMYVDGGLTVFSY